MLKSPLGRGSDRSVQPAARLFVGKRLEALCGASCQSSVPFTMQRKGRLGIAQNIGGDWKKPLSYGRLDLNPPTLSVDRFPRPRRRPEAEKPRAVRNG
jgi:hypothetical protein